MKEYKSKKEIEMAIKAAITTERDRAIKAMLRIYEYQTEDEKACGTVDNLNGVGFAGTDAELLTSFCKQFERRKSLTDKQVAILFKKIGKYAGQLTRQAISKNLYVKEGKVWKVNYAAQLQTAVAAN
ncbi:MAG: hypothetical protein IKO56_01210 [Alphaproteobacteria bacterium]|nr:hypothetical protein [Alphaproteobacteria bacterium]